MKSRMEWVSGSVCSLWAGDRGQESALQFGTALSKAQGGKLGEQQGSFVPLPDSRAWLAEAKLQPHPSQSQAHSVRSCIGPPLPPKSRRLSPCPSFSPKAPLRISDLDDGFLIYTRCISLGVEQKGNHLMAPLFSSMNTF